MKNMSIAKKITFGFLIVTLITIMVGAVGGAGMFLINQADTRLYEKQTVPLSTIANLKTRIVETRVETRNLLLNVGNEKQIQSISDSLQTMDQDIRNYFEEYMPTISSEESKALFGEAQQLYTEKYYSLLTDIVNAAKTGSESKTQEAFDALSAAKTTTMVINNLDQCWANRIENAKETSASNTQLFVTLTIVLVAVIICSTITAIWLGRYISGGISKNIKKVVDSAEKIALGDTDVNVDITSRDETGMLADSFNRMVHGIREQVGVVIAISDGNLAVNAQPRSEQDTMGLSLQKTLSKLNEMFGGINQAAVQVAIGAEQVSNGAQALSQGSTEQASSIEELSASVMEITDKLNSSAENVKTASAYVDQTVSGITQSNEYMEEMLHAMSDINSSSNEISEIIKVIDDIAFQTNILALNAAVEAARAGSAGRGFAVVADEVRNLASKSADAAKQTTMLIQESINTVGSGTQIAEKTADALVSTVEKAHQISITIDHIYKAAEEQSAAIQQINTGVEQISSVVQTNSATAEESAAASEELSGQAAMLQKEISIFKLKDCSNTPKTIDLDSPSNSFDEGGFGSDKY